MPQETFKGNREEGLKAKDRMPPRLEFLTRVVGTPRNYFHGRTYAESCVPNNILDVSENNRCGSSARGF